MATPRDKYQKLDKIGEGSCGIVFRCRCKQTGGVVAIKKVRFPYEDGGGRCDERKEQCGMFGASTQALREISLLQQLGTHPAIVQLLEVFIEPGLLYMVFQYLDRDLSRHLQEVGKLSKETFLRYSFQVLNGLVHCHARCIAHRDIKPQNILVQLKTDEVKLCDFSLSRRSLPVPREKQTQKVASLWYRSPEIFLGAATKGSSLDIWSSACVFTEMAKGKPLFPGSSEIGMLFRQFDMLGTPCNRTWPGVTGLPYWSDEFPYFGRRALGDELRLDADIVNLLEPMLQCNPLDRLAASILLTHPVFQNLDKTPVTNVSVTPEVPHPELQGDVFPTENLEMQSMTMLEDRSATRSTGKTQGFQSPEGPEADVDKRFPRPSRPLFGQEPRSQKRFKPTATSQREADRQNPLSLLEEWTRSTQPSSFRF
eukprot:s2156_g7.t1